MKVLFIIVGCFVIQANSIVNKVVDISHWNKINFKLAKEDGILGVIHKATQGLEYIDPTYRDRSKAAKKQGLLWGAYHFGVRASGIYQADHFFRAVGNRSDVLLALDIEPNGNNTMTLGQAEEFVLALVDLTHRHPIIYGSASFLSSYLGESVILRRCNLWVAHYTYDSQPRLPRGATSWLFWQYTDGVKGNKPRKVKGIGPCDRDKFNGTEQTLVNNWGHF
uniref:Lysozyme n=1 Tax=Riptortus pedestris TaxID=329032 RepID=R4WCT7_RIPPE|nr:unknown secreted protein [Riptortus pedestris]